MQGMPHWQRNEHTVDLGTLPAISVNGSEHAEHRSISWRWLTGTVLTGFASTALMGGALIAALDGQHQFATPPEVLNTQKQTEPGTDRRVKSGKTDRFRPPVAVHASKQVMQLSTITRDGDRNRIKLRPFIRIDTSLSPVKTDLSKNIPRFNPLNIFSDGELFQGGLAADSIYGAKVEGEVSIKTETFTPQTLGIDMATSLQARDVELAVADAAQFLGIGMSQTTPLSILDTPRYAMDPLYSDFKRLGVRATQENVNFIKKTTGHGTTAYSLREVEIKVKAADSFSSLLLSQGASAQDIKSIKIRLADLYTEEEFKPGQVFRFALQPKSVSAKSWQPVRLSIYDQGRHRATIARTDAGSYLLTREPDWATLRKSGDEQKTETPQLSGPMPSLYVSLYETALSYEVPQNLIKQMVRIFSFDVDYQRQIAYGDKLRLFYTMPNEQDADKAEILFAELTLSGRSRRFYRFRTPDDKSIDYYDANGKSAQKFLMRKPISRGRFRSPFGYRIHPILRTRRLHKGVDWAAPRGTPIMAAGNGVVTMAKWSSGYGRYVKIRHANGYETGYAHMSAWAKSTKKGARVRLGQVIGYAGSSGLSTGSHLHYEVQVNGRHVDPMRIKLPRGRVLKNDVLEAFRKERDRIDKLMETRNSSHSLASANTP